uniref:Uncharacterized protein n=1 Tax=Eutreptiella gymnastica TaxID=73025 RepID=A0A7S4C904_9EUGL
MRRGIHTERSESPAAAAVRPEGIGLHDHGVCTWGVDAALRSGVKSQHQPQSNVMSIDFDVPGSKRLLQPLLERTASNGPALQLRPEAPSIKQAAVLSNLVCSTATRKGWRQNGKTTNAKPPQYWRRTIVAPLTLAAGTANPVQKAFGVGEGPNGSKREAYAKKKKEMYACPSHVAGMMQCMVLPRVCASSSKYTVTFVA